MAHGEPELASFRHNETKCFDVQMNVETSERMRNERIQSWTSSGKSVKEMEPPISSDLGFAIFVWDSENVFSGKLKILVENIDWELIFSDVKKITCYTRQLFARFLRVSPPTSL